MGSYDSCSRCAGHCGRIHTTATFAKATPIGPFSSVCLSFLYYFLLINKLSFVPHSNPTLNRYRDVPCVENNRVQLDTQRYIHANWVTDIDGERRFICTQGPMKHTVDDFWQMIAQERIDAIVMLCETVEQGRPKCHQYWPPDATSPVNFLLSPLFLP